MNLFLIQELLLTEIKSNQMCLSKEIEHISKLLSCQNVH